MSSQITYVFFSKVRIACIIHFQTKNQFIIGFAQAGVEFLHNLPTKWHVRLVNSCSHVVACTQRSIKEKVTYGSIVNIGDAHILYVPVEISTYDYHMI